MENGWKVRMNTCATLRSFLNFSVLSQSEISTDTRKAFAFQHVRCRFFRAYLDGSTLMGLCFKFINKPIRAPGRRIE